jgi:hypothetical protein
MVYTIITIDEITGEKTAIRSSSIAVSLAIKEENTSAISKGQVCAVTGSSGEKIKVALANCTDATKIRIAGLASGDIGQNAVGYAVFNGVLENVDTRATNLAVNPNEEAWSAGDLLWLANTAGGMTKVRPTSGRSIKAARTVKGNSETDILVAITHGNAIWATAASGEDIVERMGDSAGANKVSYRDYADNEVASIDSNGRATFTGQVHWSKGADVASANALVLGTDGNYFDITGTTAITSIGTLGIGTVVVLHFDGILTLTYNAADLVLPGAANITTAAGDEAMFVEYATGDWRCISYTKGGVLDTVVTKTSAYTATPSDNTILCDATSAGFTIALPAASGNSGLKYNIKKIDSSVNVVTIDADGAETIDGALTLPLSSQNESYTIQCNGSAWYIL